MSETAPEWMTRASRTASRLERLFRIERKGGFDRRPGLIVEQLVKRREAIITALLSDVGQCRAGPSSSAALDRALAKLGQEVDRARQSAQARQERIVRDLRLSRGEGLPSGLRDADHGNALGSS